MEILSEVVLYGGNGKTEIFCLLIYEVVLRALRVPEALLILTDFRFVDQYSHIALVRTRSNSV
jgi:hypothetical protein